MRSRQTAAHGVRVLISRGGDVWCVLKNLPPKRRGTCLFCSLRFGLRRE